MKYFMRFTAGVDRFQQALWFIENYQDITVRQDDIRWLKNNKKYIYDEFAIGMYTSNTFKGFMWLTKVTPKDCFSNKKYTEVFYNVDIVTLGEYI